MPAAIVEKDGSLIGLINGHPHDVWDVWHRDGVEIDEGHYDYEMALQEWRRIYQPSHPKLSPFEAVDFMSIDPQFIRDL